MKKFNDKASIIYQIYSILQGRAYVWIYCTFSNIELFIRS